MPLNIQQDTNPLRNAIEAHQAGRAAEAEVGYRRVLAADPRQPDALHMLAVLYHQNGRPEVALDFMRQCLEIAPDFVDALVNAAEMYRAAGRIDEGLALVRRALALRPNDGSAYTNLAALLRSANRLPEALDAARLAMQYDPRQPLAYIHAACALIDKKPEEALPLFLKGVELNPNNPDALSSLGVCYERLGRHQDALQVQARAHQLAPRNVAIARNVGSSLANLGRYGEAVKAYELALSLDPKDVATRLSHAGCVQRCRDWNRAIDLARKIVADHPDLPDAYSLICDACSMLGQFDEAFAAIDKGLAVLPLARHYHSLGIALVRAGQPERGLEALEKALEMNPDAHILRFDVSVARILLGKYLEAWPEYEIRWKHPGMRGATANLDKPIWDGSPLNGKRLLLYAEQGMGDTVFFGRYATLIHEQKGGRVLMAVQPPLVELMKSVRGVELVFTNGVPLPEFDVHLPIMSLPGAFNTSLENIPHDVPYIKADPIKVAAWKEKLSKSRHNFRVGLVWEGGIFQAENFLRSASLQAFSPLAAVPGVSFFSLQKGPAAAQAKPANLPAAWKSPDADFTDLDDQIADFSDTAAILENLDLLISIDTSVVHVAGALARPVWMFLAFAPGHMWLTKRTDSPWYPTFTLFRQPAYQDWATPVNEVAARLRALVAAK